MPRSLTDLVYVEWIDSRASNGRWHHVEDMESKPVLMKSVGWVLSETKDHIQIVPHLGDEDSQGAGDMTIPKCAALKILNMRVPRG